MGVNGTHYAQTTAEQTKASVIWPILPRMIQDAQLSLTNRATHLCKCNDVACPVKHTPVLPHRNRRSLSKDVRMTWEYPKIGGAGAPPLGWGACLTPYKPAFPHVGHCAEFDRWWSNGASVCMEIRREKNWLLVSCLSLWNCVMAFRYKKTRMMGPPGTEKSLMISSAVLTK